MEDRKRFWELFKRHRFNGKPLTKKELKEFDRIKKRRIKRLKG